MQLVDSHCHLDFPDFEGRVDEIIQNAREADLVHALCIATSWENREAVLDLARAHPGLSASTGVHPTTTGGHEPSVDELVRAAADPLVVALGETGLDYFRTEIPDGGDPRKVLDWQHERFERHVEAARITGLPLIIHTRAAAEDTMATLERLAPREASGVMHCFAENWEIARRALDIGYRISFSGIVTFRSAKAIQEVARKAPLDRILVETDAPYLAPAPHRGKTNEPAYTAHTARFVAELRGMDIEGLAEATTENFFALFARADRGRGFAARD